jgi:hypothetical protein
MKIKRLLIDCETSPNVVYAWRCGYKLDISHESIVQERAIICVAYKWQGDSKVHVLVWKNGDDKKVIQEIVKVLDEADEVVAQNGDAFDLPWIRTRALFHGIEMNPTIKSVDTLKLSKFGFYFNSNKLDYIASFLGFGNKIKTEFQLWKDVMAGSKKALKYMVDYCKHDVVLLEKVYDKLESYGPLKTHVGVLNGGLKSDCPRCASSNVQRRGQRVSAAGAITQRLSCNDCRRMYSAALTTVNRENKLRAKRI